ncbi:MAG: class I SAM-dependent methyltransferase [Nitrospira sp.]|nr:class I SAM-dependent methyltransferase [Nitrospira sp.]
MANEGQMTTQTYWERVHAGQPRMRLPSLLRANTKNLQRLLRTLVVPGMNVLEIGFAPGKQLAYVAKILGAQVTGLDFSVQGVSFARTMFEHLGIPADLRCEDVFNTTLSAKTFDLVYSVGLIEHFDDPRTLVRRHVEFLKPGGTALILIPNYRNLYGHLQCYFDPENLTIHNLNIMTCEALKALAPVEMLSELETKRVGRIDPSQVSPHKKWPAPISKFFHHVFNAVGVVQPFDVQALCPWIAMRAVRAQ